MRCWPHAPSKSVTGPGLYIVTAGTSQKRHFFDTEEKLDLLLAAIFDVSQEQGWDFQAWAVFSNHYHIVGQAPKTEDPVRDLISRVHGRTSRALNAMDGVRGRKVWFNCWDTLITYEKSHLARLAYVHGNAVKHGLVRNGRDYPWCSAAWFEREGDRTFVKTVASLPIDQVHVHDDFEVKAVGLKPDR